MKILILKFMKKRSSLQMVSVREGNIKYSKHDTGGFVFFYYYTK